MISTYSVCSAAVIFNLFLVLVFFLRRRTRFVAQHTVALLLFISALGLVRLFTPLDLEKALVIQSWHLLPAVQSAAGAKLPALDVSIGTALLIIWACGSLVFAARDIYAASRMVRARREYTYIEDERVGTIAAKMGVKGRVRVSPQVNEPCVAGVFRPVIYLPAMELTEDELCFILRHETEHIRAGDGLKKLLLLVIKWLFWFNPFAHISMSEADKLLELRCDERVARMLDERERLRYADALLTVLRRLVPGQGASDLCSVRFAGDERAVRQRFELLLTGERHRPKSTAAIYAAAVLAFALSYFVIIQPASEPPHIGGEVAINAENSYLINDDGVYFIYFGGECCGQIPEWMLDAPPYSELKIIEEAIP